jgi:hypothetical protein
VKPENFLMGQPATPQDKKLFLVDLGLGATLSNLVCVFNILNVYRMIIPYDRYFFQEIGKMRATSDRTKNCLVYIMFR